MALTICVFEDEKFSNFLPLTYLRPVFGLRAGILPLFERARRYFPGARISLGCRDQLSAMVAREYPDYPVNIIKREEDGVLLLNGRIRDYGNLVERIEEARISTVFYAVDDVAAIIFKNDTINQLPPVTSLSDYASLLAARRANLPNMQVTSTMFNYIWEVMADIEKEIAADFKYVTRKPLPSQNIRVHDGVQWVNQNAVLLGSDVEIFPGAVLDASRGPIYVGSNCRIEPHAAIFGPAFIGPNSHVVAGKISSSSIGHTCRVGGEVEHSVFHSYVNKYHAGFIGHSYVGSWVNFGAMTTNSDLKNNYSNIRVTINGESIDSGSNKVGSFIGDHTKFGIGTLLNTGINIGLCCNIFGGGLVSDKEVPSFSWGSTGHYTPYEFEKAVETARAVAGRRDFVLTDQEIDLLKNVHSGQITSKGVFPVAG